MNIFCSNCPNEVITLLSQDGENFLCRDCWEEVCADQAILESGYQYTLSDLTPDDGTVRHDLGRPTMEPELKWESIFICAWCMPKGIPGTHGMCKKCSVKMMAELQANVPLLEPGSWKSASEYSLAIGVGDEDDDEVETTS